MGSQLCVLLRSDYSQPSEERLWGVSSPVQELQVRELRPEGEAAWPRSHSWAGEESGLGAKHPDSKSMLVSP